VSRIADEVRTERRLLRRWRPSDVEALAAIYAIPAFMEFMPFVDLDGTRRQVERFERRWEEDGYALWAVEDLATGTLLGRAGLLHTPEFDVADAVEVGWALHPGWWGRGLATEAGRAGVEAWREGLRDVPRLCSWTRPGNRRSRAVMEKLGLTLRGTTRWAGMPHVWYALDR
jgi:RimJ/RimL family protein N-acetyltransferase